VLCSKCGSEANATHRYCRPCKNAYDRERYAKKREEICRKNAEWRAAHPEKVRAGKRKWYEDNRELTIARAKARVQANPEAKRAYLAEWYQKNRGSVREKTRAKYFADPEPFKAKARAWYIANTARVREANKAWKKNNPDKARAIANRSVHVRRARKAKAFGEYTQAEWRSIVKRQKGRCAKCSIKAKLTVDHIIPLSGGGTNAAFNIQGLCLKCNLSKGSRVESGSQHSLFDVVA
jgi:5-methylcytosine-specific restriction endonuclease McrA